MIEFDKPKKNVKKDPWEYCCYVIAGVLGIAMIYFLVQTFINR